MARLLARGPKDQVGEPRDDSYIWVTWISGLLAGDRHCQWAAWFRAHYTYQKEPDDFDFIAWGARHAEMVRSRVACLERSGYQVYTEEQNRFRLPGRTATLGGAPDIIAVRDSDALVIDCKSGKPKRSDYFQVLIYMLVLPHTNPVCGGRSLTGEVQYRDRSICIEAEKLTQEMGDLIRSTIERVGGRVALPKVPSYWECRFCDITSSDCPERVDGEPPRKALKHDLF